ncbi:TPA: Slam-dependent surface lipoprotein [Neisseria gonorrhoeae]|uniref:Slam-dependent surface lipoprotein n=1 Tax=Neisseria gonorrhoeae TaxID=485 RepID=UPI0008DDC34E|nr:Slam-dependent surface lipoprotein [Neisseria gonorrhoeae]OHZ72141.1 hypothetical protein BBZ87_01150 [Neisseria gonorrhoeae]OHZ85936.1 hypothetical protein BBZ70_06025 [Neisseria gonorrhoeae]
MKYKALSLLPLAAALAACAGGGVSEPHVPVSIPPLPELKDFKLQDSKGKNADFETLNTNDSKKGKLSYGSYTGTYKNIFGEISQESGYVYTTPSGKHYQLSPYSSPVISATSKTTPFPTSHEGQRLTGGEGILFICCHNTAQNTYFPVTNHDYMKFGAWIGSNGEFDLFVGGLPVGKAGLFPEPIVNKSGSATYSVWAIRVKNGKFVTSTYSPEYQNSNPIVSKLTANFDTKKLTGTIIGNNDYGSDVNLKDVTINGIDFSGSAESGGNNGTVTGKFFGKLDGSYQDDNSIGGKITFADDRSLDTVFGGSKD